MSYGKKTGGRKKGATNIRTREIAEKAFETGISPLEYMLSVMREEIPDDAEPAIRAMMTTQKFEAAKACAPYMHPRLESVALTVPKGPDVKDNPLDLARTVAFILNLGLKNG